MKTYEDYLQECDDECENDNRHHLIGLASDLFDAMRPFIEEKNHTKVAKEIKASILMHF